MAISQTDRFVRLPTELLEVILLSSAYSYEFGRYY